MRGNFNWENVVIMLFADWMYGIRLIFKKRLSLRSTYFQIFRIFNSKQFFCSNLWNMLKSFDFVQVFKKVDSDFFLVW